MNDDFQSLFEFLPIGAYRSTPEGRMLRSNPALVQLNGCDSEAEHHALVHDIATEWYVEPRRRADFMALLERDGRVVGFISEIRRQKTRERIWVRENAHVLRHADGRVRCYEGTVEEITAEVQARQALDASRQELDRLVNLLPGAVYKTRWTPDGRSRRMLFASERIRALCGIDPAALLEQPDLIDSVRHPEDRPRVAERVREALESGAPLDVEFRVLREDGGQGWIRMTSVAAPPEEGCKVRVGMLFDITEHHHARQALAEEGELWRRAMEATGDAFWDWDLEHGTELLSGNVAALYGYAPGELPPSPDALDALTHPDDRAAMQLARDEHFAQRTPIYMNEHRVRCKDGRWKWILSRGMVIRRDGEGRPLRMIGTHADIDVARRAEELRRERDLAAAADREKSAFLSRVSHELRTPLNAVLGFAQLLTRPDAALPPGPAGWAAHVLSSGRHLLALVDDVLDLSAIQSGQLRLARDAVDMQALVAEVLAMFQPEATTAGVMVHGPADGEAAIWALGDRTRCRQIVVNLVSNGIKYNRRGGWVRIASKVAGEHIRIEVTDSGPGLDRAALARLFQPFERLQAARSGVPGTGLGLAVSRQLALAMGGAIEVDSAPGAGSRFALLLPRQLEPQA